MYSSLAQTIQQPIADWLLKEVGGAGIAGLDLDVAVITGLDALSRNGDLENLRAALGDLAMVTSVPPDLLARLRIDALAKFVGNGRGIDLAPFLLSDQEAQAMQQQQQQARVAEASATATGEAVAQQQGPV